VKTLLLFCYHDTSLLKKALVVPNKTLSSFLLFRSLTALSIVLLINFKTALLKRKDFLQLSDMGLGALMLPDTTRDGTFLIEGGEAKHAIKNFRFNGSPAAMLANFDAVGKPVRIGNSMIPPIRVQNFNFTSLSNAV
jgi:hypothetical protein